MPLTIPDRIKLVNELKLKDKSKLTDEEKKLIKLENNRRRRFEKRQNDNNFNEKCKEINKLYYNSDKGKQYHKNYYKNKVENENYREIINEKNKVKREEIRMILEEHKKLKKLINDKC